MIEEILLLLSARNTTDAVLRGTAANLDVLANSAERVDQAQQNLARSSITLENAESRLLVMNEQLSQARLRQSQQASAEALASNRVSSAILEEVQATIRLNTVQAEGAAALDRNTAAAARTTAATDQLAAAKARLAAITAAGGAGGPVGASHVFAADEAAITASYELAKAQDALAISSTRLAETQARVAAGGTVRPSTLLAQERAAALKQDAVDVATEAETIAHAHASAVNAAAASGAVIPPSPAFVGATAGVSSAEAAVLDAKNKELQISQEIFAMNGRIALASDQRIVAERGILTAQTAQDDLLERNYQTDLRILGITQARAEQEARILALQAAQVDKQVALNTAVDAPAGAKSALLGGGAMIAGTAAAFLGYEAVKKSLDFNQAIANTVAVTTQATGSIQGLHDGILSLVNGNNIFTPQDLTTGLFPILTTPGLHDTATAISALGIVSQQAQASGPEALSPIAKADTTIGSAFGLVREPNTNAQNLAAFGKVADVLTRGEQISGASPADFAKSVGTFAAAAKASGASLSDSIAVFAQESHLNPRYRLDAQQLNRLFVEENKTQKGGALATEKALNIAQFFGPGGMDLAGGFKEWLAKINTATAGPNQQQLLSQMFGNIAGLTSLRGLVGANYAQSQSLINQAANSGGSVTTEASIAQAGRLASLKDVVAVFDKQMTQLGDALVVATPLIKSGALTFFDATSKFGDLLGKSGNLLDQVNVVLSKWAKDANVPQRLSDFKTSVDKNVPGGIFTLLTGPLAPVTAGAILAGEHIGSGLRNEVNGPSPNVTAGTRTLQDEARGVIMRNGVAGHLVSVFNPHSMSTQQDWVANTPLTGTNAASGRSLTSLPTLPPWLRGQPDLVGPEAALAFRPIPFGASPTYVPPTPPVVPEPISPRNNASIAASTIAADAAEAALLARQAAALALGNAANKLKRDPAEADLRANLTSEFNNNASTKQILTTRDALIGTLRDERAAGVINKDVAGANISTVMGQVTSFLAGRLNETGADRTQGQLAIAAAQTAGDARLGQAVPLQQRIADIVAQQTAQVEQARVKDTNSKGVLDESQFRSDVIAAQIAADDLITQLTNQYDAATAAVRAGAASQTVASLALHGAPVKAQLAAIEAQRVADISAATIADRGKAKGTLGVDTTRIDAGATAASMGVLQTSANQQLQAAQLQFQASQIGYQGGAIQMQAAQLVYQAQINADKLIPDRTARTLADKAAGVNLAGISQNTAAADAQRRITTLTDERTYLQQHGESLTAINARIGTELHKDQKVLGLSDFNILNQIFANQPQITPRIQPSFAPLPGDPGLSAGRGGAQFRFGAYGVDSTAMTIALLRDQVQNLTLALAKADEQNRHLTQIEHNTNPGGAGGSVVSHHHPATTHAHHGAHATGVR